MKAANVTNRTSSVTANTSRRTSNSGPKHIGLLPFQERPSLPTLFIREAKRLHTQGENMATIQRILSGREFDKKVAGFNNKNINYYDIWSLLSDSNTRRPTKYFA